MSDGGYSRLEKDFLGNERMVHYDAGGNMLGASDVIREEDGTIRISNDPVSVGTTEELPKVEVIVPQTKSTTSQPTTPRQTSVREQARMPVSQVVTYSIGAFIATLLLTLGALSMLRSNGPDARIQTNRAPQFTPTQPNRNSVPNEALPERDNFPTDPRPRNDEQPADAPPADNTAPDSNMDDTHPRIDTNDPNAPSDTNPKPNKKGTDDPIDLRGDESDKKNPPKKGEPGTDPLRGDDIH